LESLTQELVVTSVNEDGSETRTVLSTANGKITCSDGAVILQPAVTIGADGTGGYRASKRLALRKAVNGDLIGEDRLFSVGALLWLVPVAGSQTFWYRWKARTP
jgi:hypothetical protein